MNLVALASTLIPFSVVAALSDTEGLHGNVSLLLGVSGHQSNLSVEQPALLNEERSATSSHVFQMIPIGNLTYTYGDALQYQTYMGAVREDIAVGTLAFQIGQKFQTLDGVTVDVSYLPTLLSRDVWQDPYLSNQPREQTGESGSAYRLKVDRLLSGQLGVEFAYAQSKVSEEKIDDPALARAAKSYFGKIEYHYPLNRQYMLQPSMAYLRHEADGVAASHHAVQTDISLFKKTKALSSALTFRTQFYEYEGESLEFHEIRKDARFAAVFAYEFHPQIFPKDWNFVSLLSYEQTFSNIDFYDGHEWLFSAGVSYRF